MIDHKYKNRNLNIQLKIWIHIKIKIHLYNIKKIKIKMITIKNIMIDIDNKTLVKIIPKEKGIKKVTKVIIISRKINNIVIKAEM